MSDIALSRSAGGVPVVWETPFIIIIIIIIIMCVKLLYISLSLAICRIFSVLSVQSQECPMSRMFIIHN
jgi:hypothetical protein